jgi:molybdate transport system substrate-binding protein
MSFIRLAAAALALLLSGGAARTAPPPLRIAAAADLRFALEDLVKTFRQGHSEIQVEPTYSSSGNFYSQLINQAPFDLYLSADISYPHRLAEQGLTVPESEFTYAVGHIVLWTGNASGIDVEHLKLDALRQSSVHHIAIANPEHAPYGRAAEAALRKLGIYEAVKDKLVLGENIAQAFQMVQSGAAEVGIVALSLTLAPGVAGQGHSWAIPADSYPRIQQGGVILKWTHSLAAAQAFRSFLLSPEGRAILKRYGFSGE